LNSTWKNGRLTPGYRKPFDLLAVTNLAYQKEKALSPSKDGLFDIWLPFVDSFRIELLTPSEEIFILFGMFPQTGFIDI